MKEYRRTAIILGLVALALMVICEIKNTRIERQKTEIEHWQRECNKALAGVKIVPATKIETGANPGWAAHIKTDTNQIIIRTAGITALEYQKIECQRWVELGWWNGDLSHEAMTNLFNERWKQLYQ